LPWEIRTDKSELVRWDVEGFFGIASEKWDVVRHGAQAIPQRPEPDA
jgi:hypothetical protein